MEFWPPPARQVLREHAAHFPAVQLVWRSNFGTGCGTSPLSALPANPAAFWANYSARRPLYNYHLTEGWDRIAERRFPGPNRTVLDAGALRLRPDAHVGSRPGSKYPRDCTHFCSPGPLEDLLPRLFLQLLVGLPPAGSAAPPLTAGAGLRWRRR